MLRTASGCGAAAPGKGSAAQRGTPRIGSGFRMAHLRWPQKTEAFGLGAVEMDLQQEPLANGRNVNDPDDMGEPGEIRDDVCGDRGAVLKEIPVEDNVRIIGVES